MKRRSGLSRFVVAAVMATALAFALATVFFMLWVMMPASVRRTPQIPTAPGPAAPRSVPSSGGPGAR